MPSQRMIEKIPGIRRPHPGRHLDGFEGHIVFESYNDWLVDQREERRKKGLWDPATAPKVFPPATPTKNTSSACARPPSGRSISPSSAAMSVMSSFNTSGHL